MKKSKFSEQQIAFALRQAETGTKVKEIIRKLGITEQTFYRWKKQYGGLAPSELKKMKQLEEENRRLKHMVAPKFASPHSDRRHQSGVRTPSSRSSAKFSSKAARTRAKRSSQNPLIGRSSISPPL